MKTVRLAILALLASAAACSSANESADTGPQAGADARMTGPRVAFAPTSANELPPAILGNGGDLLGVDLDYVEGDAQTKGYLAVPEGEGPFPALIIIHEWNGLVDRVRHVADDLAAEGYVTLAVDLYQGRTGSNSDENIALMREAQGDMPSLIDNLDAATAYLRSRPDVTGKVGAMGWCFGGGIALSFGLDGVDHEATGIFYGRLVEDPEVLAHMDHEVYGTFARLDRGPAPESVEAFEAALRSAGIENDLHIYDEVNHGFWLRVDGDPEARTEPALDAWNRLKAYLDRTLGS